MPDADQLTFMKENYLFCGSPSANAKAHNAECMYVDNLKQSTVGWIFKEYLQKTTRY